MCPKLDLTTKYDESFALGKFESLFNYGLTQTQ